MPMAPSTPKTTKTMLSRLIQFSLTNASLVLLAAGVLLAVVGLRLPQTPVDVFPELNAL